LSRTLTRFRSKPVVGTLNSAPNIWSKLLSFLAASISLLACCLRPASVAETGPAAGPDVKGPAVAEAAGATGISAAALLLIDAWQSTQVISMAARGSL